MTLFFFLFLLQIRSPFSSIDIYRLYSQVIKSKSKKKKGVMGYSTSKLSFQSNKDLLFNLKNR